MIGLLRALPALMGTCVAVWAGQQSSNHASFAGFCRMPSALLLSNCPATKINWCCETPETAPQAGLLPCIHTV